MTSEREIVARIVKSDDIAAGVKRLVITRADQTEFPEWTPGAHVDLRLPGGFVRQYSLCSDPTTPDRIEVAVLLDRDSRGGSKLVHSQLAPGDTLHVVGPRSNFNFVECDGGKDYLFIAGGIGITPFMPMVTAAEGQGAAWILHYAARTRGGMAFGQDLVDRHGDRVRLYISEEGQRMDLQEIISKAPDSSMIYACGPERLLQEIEKLAVGRKPDSVHMERFRPKELTGAAENTGFIVELADSGLEVEVPPELSIIESVRAAGVDVPSSCEEGTCGTCETGVLDGTPDHRDSVLSPLEREMGDTMMICVSRACGSRITLEL